MGEAQWFQPTVRNRLEKAIALTNFTIKYGKFYDISKYIIFHLYPTLLTDIMLAFQRTRSTRLRVLRVTRFPARASMNGATAAVKAPLLALRVSLRSASKRGTRSSPKFTGTVPGAGRTASPRHGSRKDTMSPLTDSAFPPAPWERAPSPFVSTNCGGYYLTSSTSSTCDYSPFSSLSTKLRERTVGIWRSLNVCTALIPMSIINCTSMWYFSWTCGCL